MKEERRKFIPKAILGTMSAAALPLYSCNGHSKNEIPNIASERFKILDEILHIPVFRKELFSEPVIIEIVQLLNYKDSFLSMVCFSDGAAGI
ncbi:hypothetical protein [Aquiflexum sp.]|uniref:hypothetical protein n=1 Tax=Aquiflexum sp. TaxID=1872584 RepID=UPI003594757D